MVVDYNEQLANTLTRQFLLVEVAQKRADCTGEADDLNSANIAIEGLTNLLYGISLWNDIATAAGDEEIESEE